MAHGVQRVVFSKQRGCLNGLNTAMMSTCSAPTLRANISFKDDKHCLVMVDRKAPFCSDDYDKILHW
jgi:hypothetical protein